MASLNKVLVIGNCGKEPEMRFTPSGKPTTSFSVAAGRSYTTQDGERKDETEWFNIVTWGKLAEFCNQYINKGQQVYVEGRLQTRSWEGHDGVTKYRTEVIANQVLLLGAKKQEAKESEPESEDVF